MGLLDWFKPNVEKLIEDIQSKDIALATKAVRTLAKTKDPRSVGLLVAALENEIYIERDGAAVSPVSEAAEEALVQIGSSAVASLIANLTRNEKPKDWLIRLKSARIIGRIGDASAVASLMPLLKDSERLVRDAAIKAFCAIGKPAADSLIVASKEDNSLMQLGAYEVLAIIGDSRAAEPLINALSNQNIEIKKQAARALGRLSESRVVAPLMACLDEHDQDLKAYAIESLVMIKEGRDALIGLLSTKENWTRRSYAIDALSDAIQFGSLKNSTCGNEVIRTAIRLGYGKVEIMSLLRLFNSIGDSRAALIGRLAESGNSNQMEQIIRGL